jgi:hypothetical protein
MGNISFEDGRAVSRAASPDRISTSERSGSGTPILDRTRTLIRNIVVSTQRNFAREMWDWARCKRVALPSVGEIGECMAALKTSNRGQDYGDSESPIFLLSTGWRSGSTLLQRILVTDPEVLLWGEPLGEMALIPGIAGMLARLCTFPELKECCSASDQVFSSLATSWIATLYPPGEDFRAGLQTLVTQWLGEPARRRGFRRWGLKEVRLGAVEATLLHWLYPKAKFVLLSRNPHDCYLSLSDSGWHHLYHSRPEIRIDSAAGLARHWNRIALSWSELPGDFPAFRIKYEDLIRGRVNFRELESWLGVKLNEDIALSALVGGTARRHRLGYCQRWIISHEAAAGMRALGYSKVA